MTGLPRIDYQFRDASLLTLALTHPSVSGIKSNQRLEFLGDAILGAVVAHILYELYPDEQEGELARRQAGLVRGEALTEQARILGLGEALKLSSGDASSGGRENPSNLEDALEALIGAIYLDGGMQAAENFIRPIWTKLAKTMEAAPKDAKTSLQEWAQGKGLPVPSYTLVEQSGPAHSPQFTVEVRVEGQPPATARAAAKRAAEQQAATILLKRLEG